MKKKVTGVGKLEIRRIEEVTNLHEQLRIVHTIGSMIKQGSLSMLNLLEFYQADAIEECYPFVEKDKTKLRDYFKQLLDNISYNDDDRIILFYLIKNHHGMVLGKMIEDEAVTLTIDQLFGEVMPLLLDALVEACLYRINVSKHFDKHLKKHCENNMNLINWAYLKQIEKDNGAG